MTTTDNSNSNNAPRSAQEETMRKRHVAATKDTAKQSPTSKVPSQGARLRQSIIQQSKMEKTQQRKIQASMESPSGLPKFYCTLVLNALALALAGVLYFKPELFFEHLKPQGRPQWPPHHLAILYPPNISPRRDVPTFYQQYAIATPHNEPTIRVMKQLIHKREKLKPFQIFITAWERERLLDEYSLDNLCGTGFQQAYHESQTRRHAEDLLHWCLLYTYQNDGFLQWNLTLLRSPISLSSTVHYSEEDTMKGIAARVVASGGTNRIHPGFLWLPKKRHRSVQDNGRTLSTFDRDSELPAQMLPWLIQHAPTINPWEYPLAVEEYLHQLIVPSESEKWIFLDTVCDPPFLEDAPLSIRSTNPHEPFQNRGVMGRDCLEGQTCCTIYLPESASPSRRFNRTKRMRSFDSSSSSDSRD